MPSKSKQIKYKAGDATRTQMLKEAGLTWEEYQNALVSLEEFIKLIDTAEQRGREEAQITEKLYTDLVNKLHKQKRCINCGRKLIEVEDPIKKKKTGYSFKCKCSPNMIISIG